LTAALQNHDVFWILLHNILQDMHLEFEITKSLEYISFEFKPKVNNGIGLSIRFEETKAFFVFRRGIS
jgi:hypothetical protein